MFLSAADDSLNFKVKLMHQVENLILPWFHAFKINSHCSAFALTHRIQHHAKSNDYAVFHRTRHLFIYLSSFQSSKTQVLNHAKELWIPVCPLVYNTHQVCWYIIILLKYKIMIYNLPLPVCSPYIRCSTAGWTLKNIIFRCILLMHNLPPFGSGTRTINLDCVMTLICQL